MLRKIFIMRWRKIPRKATSNHQSPYSQNSLIRDPSLGLTAYKTEIICLIPEITSLSRLFEPLFPELRANLACNLHIRW